MKRLATALLAVGLVLFLASSALVWYQFATTDSPSSTAAVIMSASGLLACFAVFMRSRAIAGIGVFEVTDKDRAQFQEARRELNIWGLLARFLGGLGALALMAGMMSFLGLGSFSKPDWRGGIDCFVFGGILILPAVFLAKRSKPRK